MINLLGYDKKAEIRAGRANVIIRGYIFITLIAIFFLAVLLGGTYYVLSVTRDNARARVSDGESETAKYSQTQKQADEFRKNLATTKQILDKEVSYSSLAVSIANAVPSGVILESLQLDASKLGTPITLSAQAKDNAAATNLKTSFQDNTKLFSNVSFQSIEYSQDSKDNQYPVKISLNVTINKRAVTE